MHNHGRTRRYHQFVAGQRTQSQHIVYASVTTGYPVTSLRYVNLHGFRTGIEHHNRIQP